MEKTIVIYHKSCSDGFGGAWAAWKRFGNKAIYIGAEHGLPPPKGLEGKDVYMIDFSYKAPMIQRILKKVKSLTIIDHHVTAEKVVKSLENHLYALNHSGAVLAWKYFHPSKKIPKLLLYIEDGDLWKFRLKSAKEAIAFIITQDFNFELWSKLALGFEKMKIFRKYLDMGRTIIDYEQRIIDKAIAKSDLVEFGGYKVLATNSTVLPSEIGHALVLKRPPIGIIYSQSQGMVKVSLRSNGRVDVSKIAEKYGGGGHRAASGFSFRANSKWPWRIIK